MEVFYLLYGCYSYGGDKVKSMSCQAWTGISEVS